MIAGLALALAGLLLQWLHLCPIVKRIWTSSYTLYSGGLVVLILAAFYALIELKGWKRWSFPAAGDRRQLDRHLRHELDDGALRHGRARPAPRRGRRSSFGAPFEPVLRGFVVLLVFWLILFWMYRRRIFIRI